jgi:transcriptional regulator with XRE-family HTH domain
LCFLLEKTLNIVYIRPMTIGERLRKHIKERGLLQKWVAKQAGISENTLGKILDDQHVPGGNALIGLSNALGISVDYILGLKDKAS